MIVLARLIVLVLLNLAILATSAQAAKNFVDIERVISPGGIEAWLVNDASVPVISFRFSFRGGASLDPVGKQGLAKMTSTLIDEGAGDLDSQAFQRRLQDLSIALRFHAGRDTFSGNMKTLSKNRDQAFDMVRLALTKPRFDDEPVSRLRAQLLSGLRRDQEDPDAIARKTLAEMLFPNHPYGRPVGGELKSISAITADDMRGFVARRLARDNLYVAVVGDISAAELAGQLDKIFAALP
ncbi:MAG TPA: insulinase family protein, partial [Rhodospirillales bacterium]|nr:insulinase family protein [Rhodospirillales bacterium]